MNLSESDRLRFWEKVSKTNECWLWTAALDTAGYGQFRLGQKNVKAHRVAFFIENGYNPEGFILHSCDNPACVNPAHLREGTHTDNMQDMYSRDRRSLVYTNEQVSKMRDDARNGATRQDLVDKYGGNRVAAWRAVSGKTYEWIETPTAEVLEKDKYSTKLSIEEIKEIKRQLRKPYWGQGKKLAKKYGVSNGYITHLKQGILHADVSIDE